MGRPEPIKNRFTESISDIHVKNIWLITVAGIINAFGITVFLYPVKLYDSGISGTSMLPSGPDYAGPPVFIILSHYPESPPLRLWSQERRTAFHYLFNLCCTDLFIILVSHHGRLSGRCLLRLSPGRAGPPALCPVRRCHFRRRQRSGPPVGRGHRRHRSSGCHLRKALRDLRRYFCHDL